MIQNTDIGIKDSYLLLITTKKWQGLSKRTDLYLQMNLRRMAFFCLIIWKKLIGLH